jgi:dienelactone hydrolase
MSNQISVNSHGTPIQTDLFSPAGTPNGAAVIVVHGSDGMAEPWAAMIRDYATELAANGFNALIPSYFGKTGTTAGLNVLMEIPANLLSWVEAVSDTLANAETLPGITASRVGLLGFSLGGHICLRLRGSVNVLVEYFAPKLDGLGGQRPVGSSAPDVQIHHGLADLVVPYADAQAIQAALELEGTKPEIFPYEGASHGFAGADPNNATARRSSKDRTLAFFEKHLAH